MKVSQAYNQSKGWLRPWIIHSSFRIHIIGKRFYTRLLAFELNFFIWPYSLNIFNSLCQITQSNHAIFNSTNRFLYTATFVLIPEPVFYIWLRCELCSLILTQWILLLAASYFKLDLVYFQLNFGIFVSARFRLFRPSCFVKKRGSVGNTQVLPHAKMLLALLKHKADKTLCGQIRVLNN